MVPNMAECDQKGYLEKRREFRKNPSLCPVQFCRYNSIH
jgi:hypothetical protein